MIKAQSKRHYGLRHTAQAETDLPKRDLTDAKHSTNKISSQRNASGGRFDPELDPIK